MLLGGYARVLQGLDHEHAADGPDKIRSLHGRPESDVAELSGKSSRSLTRAAALSLLPSPGLGGEFADRGPTGAESMAFDPNQATTRRLWFGAEGACSRVAGGEPDSHLGGGHVFGHSGV